MKRTQRSKSQSKRPSKKQKKSIYDNYGNGSAMTMFKRIDYVNGALEFHSNSGQSPDWFNPIGAGDAVFQRDSTRIRYKSLEFRGDIYCFPPLTAYYASDTLRIVIVYDKSPNLALPTWSNVVLSTTANSSTISPFNHSTRERFLVLYDETIRTPAFNCTVAAGATHFTDVGITPLKERTEKGNGNVAHMFKDFKLKLDSTWTGTSGIISQLMTGAFFIWAHGTMASGSSPWYLNYSTSLKYTDTPC